MTHTLPLSSIIVSNRLRKDYGDIDELASSIQEHGLIQPLLVDSDFNLVAGGRRHAAISKCGWTDVNGEIPVYIRYDLGDEVSKQQIELEENIRRKAMAWQEISLGIHSVHKARKHQASLKSESWTQQATGDLLNVSRAHIQSNILVATALENGDDEVAKADNFFVAYGILLERSRKASEAELRKRKEQAVAAQKKLDAIPNNLILDNFDDAIKTAVEVGDANVNEAYAFAMTIAHEGDSINTILPSLPSESFNHVYTDIPYGIDTDNLLLKGIDETSAEHDRDDNIALFGSFLTQSYRLIKPKGFCVFWCDIEHWGALYSLAKQVGFSVQRWPLIWTKTSACKNNAAAYNFTKNYEIAIFCRKEGAVLLSAQSTSYFPATWEKDERASFKHPFCKPNNLHKWVLSSFATVGDTILNPYCGEGSELLTCLRLGLHPTGYDINPVHITRCREHIQNLCLTTPSIMSH